MKYFIYPIMFLLCISAYSQDPGDPVLTCDVNQDFQIRWRGETEWAIVVPTELLYLPGPVVGNHNWVGWATVSPFTQTWEGAMPDDATKIRTTLDVVIPVLLPPDPIWWTFYEFRWRCRTYAGTEYEQASPWSEPGKKYIITFNLLWKPIASL